jgi:uncharacterized iron-regulated membrane protein
MLVPQDLYHLQNSRIRIFELHNLLLKWHSLQLLMLFLEFLHGTLYFLDQYSYAIWKHALKFYDFILLLKRKLFS